MISLRGVEKRYGRESGAAVHDLSLDIAKGETVVLVGPSGCGKTTTLKMINRLIEPTAGEILVGGTNVLEQDPVRLRRGIGYVIQSIGLLPHRTIRQNIATVPELVGWDRGRIHERVRELASMLRLGDELLDRYPGELSGGQRQRVGVARALAVDPPVMLMDEPFGAVDPIIRARLQDQFMELQRDLKKTVVFVTHDIDEAMKLGQIEVVDGPVVPPSAPAAQAIAEMERAGFDWVSVVDDGVLLGWVDRSALDGAATVGDVPPRRFGAYVTAQDSLRQALDSIVTHRTNVAVVVSEGQRYRGILTLERVSREIIS